MWHAVLFVMRLVNPQKRLRAVRPRLHRNSRQRLLHEQSHKHAVNAGNSFYNIETGWMKASAVMVVV